MSENGPSLDYYKGLDRDRLGSLGNGKMGKFISLVTEFWTPLYIYIYIIHLVNFYS
jgi:hypothetical protein